MALRIQPPSVPPALAAASQFLERFVSDAHFLIATGFAALNAGSLSGLEEEVISGRIVEEIRNWLDSASAEWAKRFSAASEYPVPHPTRQGKKRPRLDIRIESNEQQPRPRLGFEAKRFYRSDSVADYVGAGGLGQFLNGDYTPHKETSGAMLGYVQNESIDHYRTKVQTKLEKERAKHGLSASGDVWCDKTFTPQLGITRVSKHQRNALPDITIYHTFLKCF